MSKIRKKGYYDGRLSGVIAYRSNDKARESESEEHQTVKVAWRREPHCFRVRRPRQDFPFNSQAASHGVCLIIEAERRLTSVTITVTVLVKQNFEEQCYQKALAVTTNSETTKSF